MKEIKEFRNAMYLLALGSFLLSIFLSFQVDTFYQTTDGDTRGVAAGIDSAKDGGAIGLAILAGLALIAASITFLKDEKHPFSIKDLKD